MTDRKAEFVATHPDVYFLDAGDLAAMGRYLRARGWLSRDEAVVEAGRPGEGNMNCTLRVSTGARRFIVKQSRPWVEKYDAIAAPWDRALVEAAFYDAVASVPAVRDRMPRLLGRDPEARILVLEDLGESRDLTRLYAGQALTGEELDELVAYLGALHGVRIAPRDAELFANRPMRALNHEYIFEQPLTADAATLDAITPGLADAAAVLSGDAAYVSVVAELGVGYLADGPTLVHGDYFPGSWLDTTRGLRVIDPEFCFLGDAAFDVGVFVAHLVLADQPPGLPTRLLDAYARVAPPGWDETSRRRALRLAGVEIMRRLIGVAQLPLSAGSSRKAELLALSRRLVLEPDSSAPRLDG